MSKTMTMNEVLSSQLTIRLYGHEITDLSLGGKLGVDLESKGNIAFALIRAFAVGGYCTTLPTPTILVVVGPGETPDPDDSCAKKDEMVWSIGHQDETLNIVVNRGPVVELLDAARTRGISGGIAIENPSVQNGQLCGTIHLWYDIEVFGQHAKDDKRIPFCVPLQGCYSIWDFGLGDVSVCVSPDGDGLKICGKLCVGKWGLQQCWDACTHVGLPFASGSSNSGSKCGCAD